MNGTTGRGFGWIAFAGYILIIGGAFNIMDGIVALARSSYFVAGAHYVFSDLRTWGWIILGLGIVEVLAGFSIFTGSQWARWVGIGIAALNALGQLMFAQAYPLWSLIIIGVDLLVIYGLAVYGGQVAAAARAEDLEEIRRRAA